MCLSAKIANFLSHTELKHFARDRIAKIVDKKNKSQVQSLKKIEDQLQYYARICSELTENETGRTVDQLEARRYFLWETIVDRLDDNLNIGIEDSVGILHKYDYTEKQALSIIPEYGASTALTDSDCERLSQTWREHHADGHFHNNQDMCGLIKRIISPDNFVLCKTAGIADGVEELRELEETLQQHIDCLPGDTDIGEIREVRYQLCCRLRELGPCRLKQPRHAKSYEVLEDRIREKELCRRLGMFSPDQLSPGGFLTTLEKIGPLLKSRNEYMKFTPVEEDTKLHEYRKLIQGFIQHPLWKRFDELEGDFYRSSVSLMDQITIHVPGYMGTNVEIWEWHRKKKPFQAAVSLLGELDAVTGFTCMMQWTPDTILGIEMIEKMLQRWNTPQCREFLKSCGCDGQFDFCRHLHESTRSLAAQILDESPPLKLFKMRKLRYRLSLQWELITAD